jgi:group II intron reverse transcriptase/maturase
MTIECCRKEEKSEAETKETSRKLIPPLNGAEAGKAANENSVLPSSQANSTYIATIGNAVSDLNIQRATKAIISNKGAPGIDGITTEQIKEVMREHWPKIKEEILDGKYQPKPVKRVEIPKPDGGIRQLGIPTVMDRIIQQAIHQELNPVFEPIFSQDSYGFRPNRNAHQAVFKAQEYLQEGCEWVIDIDLEKFFDRVNHDMLMARVARRVKDKKILLLIRRYLQSGCMEEGLVKPSEEGTPQGGPLSPLLSNIMLDDLDKELEKRGLRFARYADDCNIYVKSEKAGKRVMESIVRYLSEKLKLKVNQQKSAVDQPWNRKFLGFTFKKEKGPNRIAIHKSRIKRFKDKIKKLTKRMRGREITDSIRKLIMPITRGWANYFRIAGGRGPFENLDGWIRRKIRAILWRQWKRAHTRYKRLIALGLKEHIAKQTAYVSKGPWRMARTYGMHRALSNSVIEAMGYTPMETIAARVKVL